MKSFKDASYFFKLLSKLDINCCTGIYWDYLKRAEVYKPDCINQGILLEMMLISIANEIPLTEENLQWFIENWKTVFPPIYRKRVYAGLSNTTDIAYSQELKLSLLLPRIAGSLPGLIDAIGSEMGMALSTGPSLCRTGDIIPRITGPVVTNHVTYSFLEPMEKSSLTYV